MFNLLYGNALEEIKKIKERSIKEEKEKMERIKENTLEMIKKYDGDFLDGTGHTYGPMQIFKQFDYPELLEDKEFMLKAHEMDYKAIQYASANLLGNSDFILSIKGDEHLKYASTTLRDDEIFMLKFIKRGRGMEFASSRLKESPEFVLKAIDVGYASGLKFVSPSLLSSTEFINKAVKVTSDALQYSHLDIQVKYQTAIEEYESSKIEARKQLQSFEALANSMTSYKNQKTTAEATASTKLNALNPTINTLNTQKTEAAKLEAIKLVKITAGSYTNSTFNSEMLNVIRIPLNSFTPAIDPHDFSAEVNYLKDAQVAFNKLAPPYGSHFFLGPKEPQRLVMNLPEIEEGRNQANAIANTIRSAKATLEAAKNKYIQGKAHADSKAAEFQQETERNNTEQVAQVRSTQETKNEIKLNIIDKINIQDSHGETPLIKAAKQGNYVAINYMFENMSPEQINHIRFEAKDTSGKTALHYLVEKSMQVEANKFITNGASPYIPDAEGKTAYDLASDNAMEDLCNLMRETFGDPPAEVSLPSDLAAYIEANRAEENAERDEDLLSSITDLSDFNEGVQNLGIAGQGGFEDTVHNL